MVALLVALSMVDNNIGMRDRGSGIGYVASRGGASRDPPSC